MRNKPYVVGLVAAAVLLIYFAIRLALGESGPILAAVPGVLGVALLAASWKVAKADSFAPKKSERWDYAQTPQVERWQHDRAERESQTNETTPR